MRGGEQGLKGKLSYQNLEATADTISDVDSATESPKSTFLRLKEVVKDKDVLASCPGPLFFAAKFVRISQLQFVA